MRKLKHPVNSNVLNKLGDLVVSYSVLDSQIKSLAGSMINENQRVTQIIIEELDFKRVCNLIKCLYIEHNGQDTEYKELLALISKADKITTVRNKFMHSIWGAGGNDSNTRLKITAKKQFKVEGEDVTPDKLELIVEEIKILSAQLLDFTLNLISKGKAINNPTQHTWGKRKIE